MVWITNGDTGLSVRTKLNTIPNDGTNATPALVLIQTLTPSSGNVASFTSIPATYKHLILEISARSDAAGVTAVNCSTTFNGDGGANYDVIGASVGGAVSAFGSYGQTGIITFCTLTGATATANRVGGGTLKILNYANTGKNKIGTYNNTFFGTSTTGSSGYTGGGFQWLSTAAINRIDFTIGSSAAFTGSDNVLSLYGEQ